MAANATAWIDLELSLSRRERRELRRAARRDGRRAVMPRDGTTPSADHIRSQARALVQARARSANDRESEYAIDLAIVDSDITAAHGHHASAKQTADDVPAHIDTDRLPDRAVSGDPKLIRSLTVAKAEAELRTTRSNATAAVHATRQQVDTLDTRRAELLERMERLRPDVVEHARQVASQADIRLTYYSARLLRWHKKRDELRPLLPLTPVSNQLDQLLTQPTEDFQARSRRTATTSE